MQFIAIVGASGAGKSTLLNLLSGLYQPSEGQVLFDGRPVCEVGLAVLRGSIGVVAQSPFFFAGTIRQNIALSNPAASNEAVVAAAMTAQVHDDITAMPMGYETWLAENGSSLSGGQRQRLALARALLRRPPILLLDEATSALDANTEWKVVEGVASLRCTRVVVAHRLSTIANADTIVVLEGGRIVESGSHSQLLGRGGQYAQLVSNQLLRSA